MSFFLVTQSGKPSQGARENHDLSHCAESRNGPTDYANCTKAYAQRPVNPGNLVIRGSSYDWRMWGGVESGISGRRGRDG
jgi:hypothetical protein